MAWTLEHDGDERTLEEWGLEGVRLAKTNRRAGTLTGAIAADMDQAVPWVPDDPVILRKDGAVCWRGFARPVKRGGDESGERLQAVFVDAWWWFAQGSYSQEIWDQATSAAVTSSAVALFAAITPGTGWSMQSVGAQIAAIVAHCNTLHGGGIMQLGELNGEGFALVPLVTDLLNITHEQALERCLALVPDAVPQWDYSTNPPTLNFCQRSAATERTFSMTDGLQVRQAFVPRDDLVVRGVRLCYIVRDANGQQSVIVDAAGESSGKGIVTGTVDLSGGGMGTGGGAGGDPVGVPAVGEQQELVSETIDPLSAEWWFKSGFSGAAALSDILIVGAGSSMVLDPNAPENEGHEDIGGCNRWLRAGSIGGWQGRNHFRRVIVTGYLTLRYEFEYAEGVYVEFRDKRTITVALPATDLVTGTHSNQLQSPGFVGGDEEGGGMGAAFVPTGIAAQLLASLSELHHEGEAAWQEQECSLALDIGDVVNITDGPEDWASMRAQVQQLTLDIDNGETEAVMGPPDHLSVQEFMNLLRIMRVGAALDLDRRATGSGGGGAGFSGYDIKHPFTGNTAVSVSDVLVDTAIVDNENGTEMDIKSSEATIRVKDSDQRETTIKPQEFKMTDASGATLTLSTATGITFTKDGKTARLSIDELLIDRGTGQPSARLRADTGFTHSGGGGVAKLYAVPGQTIEPTDTEFCEGGESATAKVVRGAAS